MSADPAVLDKASRNPHDVRVGQLWRDNDPRCPNRLVKIIAIAGAYAHVCRVDSQGQLHAGEQRRLDNRKPRKIRLDRFRPTNTGYALHRK